MKVVELNKYRDCDMFKIEGDGFHKIKKIEDAINRHRDEAHRKDKKIHTALWDAIYEEIGENKRDGALCLDTEYKELGIYMVKKAEENGFVNFLQSMKGD